MAKLTFRYGAMGSSKTANAIMVQYNYRERGQNALLLKPRLDDRDGARVVRSRSGLSAPCRYVEELDALDLSGVHCLIVDEAQFLTKAQVQRLADIVDDLDIPVICYGLRADFQGNLFEGSQWLLTWADNIEEVRTVCWCGKKATANARLMDGRVVRSGAQIVLGGSERYVALCRRHWRRGELAPEEIRRIATGREDYLPLLLEADPSREMIERYLCDGELYVLFVSGQPASVAVIAPREDGGCELKNLATAPELRGTGRGSRLLRHLVQLCAADYPRMWVGTSPANVDFYKRFGFKERGVLPHFFRDNYPEPIYEEGKALDDMLMLCIDL